MALKITTTIRSALATSLNTEIGASCQIKIYAGSRPADPQTAISGQTLLGTLTGNAGGFGSVSNGVLTASAITQDSAADNTGTASFFRIFKSDGTTVVMDGDIGTSGSDLNLNTTSVVANGPIQISSFAITMPNA